MDWTMRRKVYSTLDFTRGYWQAHLDEESKRLTAFTTHYGIYAWNRVPMGLHASGGYFQAIMQNIILRPVLNDACVIYIDDCLVGST